MPVPRRQRRSSIGEHHAEWLSLVQTSGPFLTVPMLEKVLPDGLDAAGDLADLRVAYSEWRDNESLAERWVRWVLDELLGLRDATAEATDLDPSHRIAEHGVTLRASYVVARPCPRRRARRPVGAPPSARHAARPPVDKARHGLPARSIAPPSWPARSTFRSRW